VRLIDTRFLPKRGVAISSLGQVELVGQHSDAMCLLDRVEVLSAARFSDQAEHEAVRLLGLVANQRRHSLETGQAGRPPAPVSPASSW